MQEGAEDGTKGMKGNTRPDRQVRKVQQARSKPQRPWYATGKRKKDKDIGRYVSVGRTKQWERWERKQEEKQVGARCATPGYNREEDGDVEQADEERQESVMRELKRTRRDGRVRLSEKSRAVARGSRERKGLSRCRDLHIPWGQWDGAMWRHGLSVLFWFRWPGLRSDYGAVALGRAGIRRRLVARWCRTLRELSCSRASVDWWTWSLVRWTARVPCLRCAVTLSSSWWQLLLSAGLIMLKTVWR